MAAEARYLPFGEQRWESGQGQTDFGFTGQRGEGFGLVDFRARFYSPALMRFVSADSLVPEAVQGVQAWDRYAYVNNNPVRYRDTPGHCIDRGTDTCLTWDNPFGQQQVGNTCAVTSMAVAISIVLNTKVALADIRPLYPGTYVGIGVVPNNQPRAAIIDPRIKATFAQGTRAALENNLQYALPSVVSFTVPGGDIGHAVVVTGQNTVTGELIFFDPATNTFLYERDLFYYYDHGRGFENFDALWADSNVFIPANSMVTVEYVPTNISVISLSSFKGGLGFFERIIHLMQ